MITATKTETNVLKTRYEYVIKLKGRQRKRYKIVLRAANMRMKGLQACTCFGLKATYHDRFNAGATLRSKFDDERNT